MCRTSTPPPRWLRLLKVSRKGSNGVFTLSSARSAYKAVSHTMRGNATECRKRRNRVMMFHWLFSREHRIISLIRVTTPSFAIGQSISLVAAVHAVLGDGAASPSPTLFDACQPPIQAVGASLQAVSARLGVLVLCSSEPCLRES